MINLQQYLRFTGQKTVDAKNLFIEHRLSTTKKHSLNIHFSDENFKPLLQFFFDKFNLRMNNDPTISMTIFNTTIDAGLSRYVHNIVSCHDLQHFYISIFYFILSL